MLFLFYYRVPGVRAVFDIKCKIVNWFLSRPSAPSPLVQVTPDFCFQSWKKIKKRWWKGCASWWRTKLETRELSKKKKTQEAQIGSPCQLFFFDAEFSLVRECWRKHGVTGWMTLGRRFQTKKEREQKEKKGKNIGIVEEKLAESRKGWILMLYNQKQKGSGTFSKR